MDDFPSPSVAMSLWTFGRETPIDGDKLAFSLMWERKTRDYFRGLLSHPTDQWVTTPDGEEFRAGECQGHDDCPVETHEHGCFADAGSCDHPEEHHPTDPE